MRIAAAFLLVLALPSCAAAEGPRPISDRGVENLVALARLTGYLRYFHPSEAAVAADWNQLTVRAVRQIEDARDARELASRLQSFFGHVAPTMRVFVTGTARPALPAALRRPENMTGVEVVQWRHRGLGLWTQQPQMYESRVVTTTTADPAQPLIKELGGGVSVMLPIALYRGVGVAAPSMPRRRAIGGGTPPAETLSADDRETRLAIVALAWTTMQHFYPYWEAVDVDWPAALRDALRTAATDADSPTFQHGTFSRLNAAMRDGHGRAIGPHSPRRPSYAPLLWTVIDDRLIVIRSTSAELAPGDEVLEIDGRPAMDAVREAMTLVSAATEGYVRYLALQKLRTGENGSTLTLKTQPAAGPSKTVALRRTVSAFEAATGSMSESGLDATVEVRPGVWYLDISRLTDARWTAVRPSLEKAKGVIFDFRGYPAFSTSVLAHFTSERHQSAHFRVPVYQQPDNVAPEFTESRWNVPPASPRINAKVAFITDGRAVSYAESLMGIVEAYEIGAIVGEPTAGTNGNLNFVDLPAGYRWAFTGMLVVKHDGSRHHGVGIHPTIPVSRTREGVRKGLDEMLEAAIATF